MNSNKISSDQLKELLVQKEVINLSRDYKKILTPPLNEIININKNFLKNYAYINLVTLRYYNSIDKNFLFQSITAISLFIDSSYPIVQKTKPPFIMRSLMSASISMIPILFLWVAAYVIHGKLYNSIIPSLITVSTTLFIGFFAYNYIAFNNKWRYVADLYNKIYIDSFNNDDLLELFRKKCLLTQDIYDLNLYINKSYQHEFFKNLTIAAMIYDRYIKNGEAFTIQGNTITFNISPEIILTRVSYLIVDTLELEKYEKTKNLKNDQTEILEEIKAFKKQKEEVQKLIIIIKNKNAQKLDLKNDFEEIDKILAS